MRINPKQLSLQERQPSPTEQTVHFLAGHIAASDQSVVVYGWHTANMARGKKSARKSLVHCTHRLIASNALFVTTNQLALVKARPGFRRFRVPRQTETANYSRLPTIYHSGPVDLLKRSNVFRRIAILFLLASTCLAQDILVARWSRVIWEAVNHF